LAVMGGAPHTNIVVVGAPTSRWSYGQHTHAGRATSMVCFGLRGDRRLIMAADMRPRKHSTPLLEVVRTVINTARLPAWILVRDRRARLPYAPWHQHTPTPMLIPSGDHGRCQVGMRRELQTIQEQAQKLQVAVDDANEQLQAREVELEATQQELQHTAAQSNKVLRCCRRRWPAQCCGGEWVAPALLVGLKLFKRSE
jgi:hypothetical protein